MKLLVTLNKDWADEFDVHGFKLMDPLEYDKLLAWAENATWYFGTNEGFEDEDLRPYFKAEPVSEEEIAVLCKLFPELQREYSPSVGQFPDDYAFSEPDEG